MELLIYKIKYTWRIYVKKNKNHSTRENQDKHAIANKIGFNNNIILNIYAIIICKRCACIYRMHQAAGVVNRSGLYTSRCKLDNIKRISDRIWLRKIIIFDSENGLPCGAHTNTIIIIKARRTELCLIVYYVWRSRPEGGKLI